MASISLLDMVLALSLSFLLGLFLFLVYKKNLRGSYVFRQFWSDDSLPWQ